MLLPFKIALRELRGGLSDFRLFLVCLIVGVTVIAAVGLLAERVRDGMQGEARTLLGGDVEIGISNAGATPEQLEFLRSYGKVSLLVNMRAMATYGTESTLVELKGVDERYPLVGHAELASGLQLIHALEGGHVVIGQDLSDRLGVKPGDDLILGDASFTVADILQKEPDHISGAFSLGPRVIALASDLKKAGLLQPGSLIRYNYRVLLKNGSRPDDFKEAIAQRFAHAPWIVRTFNGSNRTVQGLVERLQLFLTLAGLSSLLIGGVGILNASESYIAAKSTTIATFKALGAKRDTVFAVYMIVLFIITLLGIAISLFAGVLLSMLLLPYLTQFFPVSPGASEDVKPLLLAAGFGALTVFTFSIAALSRGIEVKPTLLFRGLGNMGSLKITRGRLLVNLLLGIALIVLVVVTAGDPKIAAGFIMAALAAFGVFIFAARIMVFAARRMRLPPGLLRLAVASLHRPGAPVFSIMLSIGIGLSVLMVLLQVEGNVERDIKESIPAQAPSLFLIDIQPSQKDALKAFLTPRSYIFGMLSQPMVRGRIAKLKGMAVERAPVSDDVKWATESDRGFTYAAAPPEGTRIAEGSWWPADYHGRPLASLDRKLAEGMGLHVGDTITINILGEDIDAQIANLRDINYMSLRMNFALILSPGAIERFPSTGITTLHVSGRENEAALVHEMAKKFPNVSAISVRETLARFEEIVGHIETAVRVTALFTLISGVMVLSSALAATLDKRAFDTVMFKVLGARKRDILTLFLSEWLIIACVTCMISCVFGSIGARLILLRFEWVEFHLLPGTILKAMLLTLAFIACVGLLLQSRAFAPGANAALRNE
jgi:putative ABC transport system permease protein